MKRALYTADIDLTTGPQFKMTIPDPGQVIRVRTIYRNKSLLTTMAKPPLVPITQLVFLVDPDAPARERFFIALPENTVMGGDGHVEFCGTCEDPRKPDGILAIFETMQLLPVTGAEDPTCTADQHVWTKGHEWCNCGDRHMGMGNITEVATGEGAA